jgi:hypothetical protein
MNGRYAIDRYHPAFDATFNFKGIQSDLFLSTAQFDKVGRQYDLQAKILESKCNTELVPKLLLLS